VPAGAAQKQSRSPKGADHRTLGRTATACTSMAAARPASTEALQNKPHFGDILRVASELEGPGENRRRGFFAAFPEDCIRCTTTGGALSIKKTGYADALGGRDGRLRTSGSNGRQNQQRNQRTCTKFAGGCASRRSAASASGVARPPPTEKSPPHEGRMGPVLCHGFRRIARFAEGKPCPERIAWAPVGKGRVQDFFASAISFKRKLCAAGPRTSRAKTHSFSSACF